MHIKLVFLGCYVCLEVQRIGNHNFYANPYYLVLPFLMIRYNLVTSTLSYIGVYVRLVGGSSYNEGRVEVYYNYQWGTVCDDGWDDTDAGVVCRQLGFGSSGTATGSAGFGYGSGSIWLNSVTCIGNESTLASCGHPGVGITSSCYHNEDAGVRCTGVGKDCMKFREFNLS